MDSLSRSGVSSKAGARRVLLDYGRARPSALTTDGKELDELLRLGSAPLERARAAMKSKTGEASAVLALPEERRLFEDVQRQAERAPPDTRALVVMGMGGSTLGAMALADGLLDPAWNHLGPEARKGRPRVFFCDNPDPSSLAALLSILDPARSLVNVVSKSGTTTETLAFAMIARQWLRDALPPRDARRRVVATTGDFSSPLGAMAAREGWDTLGVPARVGGRFSVLTPVGLYPAQLLGMDLRALRLGAARMRARCLRPEFRENPAAVLATLLHAWDRMEKRGVQILMPYADRLARFAQWVVQLWAESLGKSKDGEAALLPSGPSPAPARGATDQHSRLQLWMDGPPRNVIVFIELSALGADLRIPASSDRRLAHLGEHALGELLRRQRLATAEALHRAGTPSLLLKIRKWDAEAMGELIMLFQTATLYAAALYGVNPFDQPGVELGKRLTRELLKGGAPDWPGGSSAERWTVD